MSIFFSGQTKWIVLFVTDNVHWRCRRNGWNHGRNWVSEGEWYWLKALISAVFNQMLTKICYFLSTGDWRTFKWKFDSGRWRCCVTRIRGDDKGLYFVPSAVLIFTPGSLIMSSREGAKGSFFFPLIAKRRKKERSWEPGLFKARALLIQPWKFH